MRIRPAPVHGLIVAVAMLLLSACSGGRDRAVAYAMIPANPAAGLRAQAPLPSHMLLRRSMLLMHADARRAVGLAPLAWDDGLAGEAERYATLLARTGRFEHERQDAEGENLWAGTHGAFGYDQMAAAWIDEKRHYVARPTGQASRTGRFEDVGHYTQIVWWETRAVGCGVASNRREDVLVCRYLPRGNWIGEMAY